VFRCAPPACPSPASHGWLPWPIVPKRQWPAVEFREKRGISLAEHLAIVAREQNPERKAFYKTRVALGRIAIRSGRLERRGC